MNVLGRLKLWQKLAILVAGLVIPTILAGAFYFRTVSDNIRLARAELDGARYLQPLGAVLAEVFTHRGSAHALLNGDAGQKQALAGSESRMDALLAAVDKVDGELNTQFHSSYQWRTIKAAWTDLKARNSKLTPARQPEPARRAGGQASGAQSQHLDEIGAGARSRRPIPAS